MLLASGALGIRFAAMSAHLFDKCHQFEGNKHFCRFKIKHIRTKEQFAVSQRGPMKPVSQLQVMLCKV